MRRLYPATLLVSAGAIGYEILLMRVLSIVQWHHFAYMIISLALLGYGASGTFIALARAWLAPRFEAAFSASAALFSVTMVACFMLAQRVPFNALEIVWNPRQFAWLSLVYLLFFLPFFFAATCIGLFLSCRRNVVSRIYFFDLLGAGLGAAAIIGLLFVLLPQHALRALATLALAGALLAAAGTRVRGVLITVQAAWLLALAWGFPPSWLALHVSDYKGLSQALQVIDSRVLTVRSGPLGLLTVVESPTVPFRHAPGLSFASRHVPPEQLAVFTDGEGMSALTRFDGELAALGYLGDITAALPYQLTEAPEVLVLGAGAGSDVLLALLHGARRIDAVELDPQMIELVRGTHGGFAGRLYDHPRVDVHIGEARGYVARSSDRYDLIQIGLLDSFAASGSGVQGLNESYLYTVEAMREYLRHLRPGGVLAITRWLKLPPRDSLKLAATAIAALRAEGVPAPAERLAMIRSWNTSTLLIRNGGFSSGDIAAIEAFARSRSFDTVHYPGMSAAQANRYNRLDTPYLYEGVAALLGEHAAAYVERYKFRIAPATDDRPYFFHFFRWRTLPEVMALRGQGGAGLIEWAYLILVGTLAQALLAGLLLILLPLVAIERRWPRGTGRRMGGYFFLLGLAFLFVEMAFIQKFTLFLSHPLYSVAVVLAGFLIFAGVGSAYAGRLKGAAAVPRAVLAIAGITLVYIALLPRFLELFLGFNDLFKILLSMALIAPLGFVMGMPFPLGLQRLAAEAPAFIPWAWGLNGFASVLSAVLATLLAIEFGFTAVVLLALCLYGGAAWLSCRA